MQAESTAAVISQPQRMQFRAPVIVPLHHHRIITDQTGRNTLAWRPVPIVWRRNEIRCVHFDPLFWQTV
jgi:hypothetical protein